MCLTQELLADGPRAVQTLDHSCMGSLWLHYKAVHQQLQPHCKLCVSAQRAMLAEEASCYQLDCSRGHSTDPGKQGRKSLLWLRTSRDGQKSGPFLPGPAVTHCSPPETSSAPTESSWKTQHFIFLKQINTLSNVPIYTEMQFWKY